MNGWRCYRAREGDPETPVPATPTLDRLAAGGTRFTHCFGQSPIGGPSRACMMTCRYPRHIGVRWHCDRVSEQEVTLPESLKSQGYATASIGKRHVAQKRFLDSIDHVDLGGIRRNWQENPDEKYIVNDPNPFARILLSIVRENTR